MILSSSMALRHIGTVLALACFWYTGIVRLRVHLNRREAVAGSHLGTKTSSTPVPHPSREIPKRPLSMSSRCITLRGYTRTYKFSGAGPPSRPSTQYAIECDGVHSARWTRGGAVKRRMYPQIAATAAAPTRSRTACHVMSTIPYHSRRTPPRHARRAVDRPASWSRGRLRRERRGGVRRKPRTRAKSARFFNLTNQYCTCDETIAYQSPSLHTYL